jgi:hypothetical protein
MTSLLSPLAPVYTPSRGYESLPEYEICICNDGVPAMSPADVHSEQELLSGIADEAIDDCFPPTAQEVAEMEAAEMFVALMSHLSLLEEREEHDRTDLSEFAKRWEARRAEGLVGKPHPPMEHKQDTASHHTKEVHETKLVTYDQRHKNLAILQTRDRDRVRAEDKRMFTKVKKNRARPPIIQPRKLTS